MATCGRCKATGVDVAHVRNCYIDKYAGVDIADRLQEKSAVQQREREDDERAYAAKARRDERLFESGLAGDILRCEPMHPASDKQIKYVLGLQDERETGPDWKDYTDERLRLMERVDVSKVINTLKAMPVKERAERVSGNWTMPAGRYALNNSGTWIFYQVDRPTDGRWKGYTFLKRLIGAPGDYQKMPVQQPVRDNVLGTIERDPKQAAIDYGLQSGVCGMCSSPLSDPQSLARGIGPICAGKSGWF